MTTYPDIPFLDLRPQQEAIMEKYGDRWFASDDARAEAGVLWGMSSQREGMNDCGVFIEPEEVMLAQCDRSYALAQLAHAPNGLWAVSVSYQLPLRGFHAPVSVWNRRAFPSRDAARLVAIHDLIHRLSCNREKVRMIIKTGPAGGRENPAIVALLNEDGT